MAGTTLGTAYVQIVPSAQGIKGSIQSALGGEAEAAGLSAGGKIGAFAKKALTKVAIGAAVVKTVKGALDEGAKLQQSYLGGLDTLYGEAAEGARAYAREAAAAGISMNDYSEQAVSFGAALKNAYGGDTYKAMEAANTAILDMADNSAKMGTDITSVQMAYQGFAKQNYTMLDNLKLGYGGTKSEMERLLADAEELTGVHYDINNLGDVYSAIHAIQGDLGLTGVAAEEASQTFSGSFGAMKASAANFLGSLALGENVSGSLNQLMTSASTFFFGNFLPMIGTLIKSLPSAIGTFLQQGVPMLLSQVSSLITNFANSITNLANGMSSGKIQQWASTTLPKIISTAGQLIGKFAGALLKNIPKIVVALGKIGLTIIKGLGSAIWGKVTQAAQGILTRFLAPIQTLQAKVKAIIDKIKGFFKFKTATPHIKVPHFSITPAGWKVGDLLKGVKPKLGITWAARGGIVDGATLVGAGEAGAEAIVPLDPFWRKMDEIANSIRQTPSGGAEITVVVNLDGREVARTTAPYMETEINRIQNRANRKLGYI